jgi:3-oxoacyl-[acyl-carrier-protein] synthase-1
LAGINTPDVAERLYGSLTTVVEQALGASGLSRNQRKHCALLLGSSSFDIGISEAQYRHDLLDNPNAYPMRPARFDAITRHLQTTFDLHGPVLIFNTACTSSANALIYAYQLLTAGVVEQALVIGIEIFSQLVVQGFTGLELLSNAVMQPFGSGRQGLNLGEAVSAAVFGRGSGPLQIVGTGNLCDTYGISSADPSGISVAGAIKQALAEAAIPASKVIAVKAHGTASLRNDETEAAGLARCFDPIPPVYALKPYIGHTLGACGLTELLVSHYAWMSGMVPANPGLLPDTDLGMTLANEITTAYSGYYVLNYFGFGGNNSVLVVQHNALGQGWS